jgi:hypothetical protein
MTAPFIKRHIRRLPSRELFSTRDMLIYGTRTAVDSALSRMVKEGFIQRLARGIFVRDASGNPTAEDIAIAKAKAFKVQLRLIPEYFLKKLGITFESHCATYARSGHSCSFGTIKGRIAFRAYGPRKMNLLETVVGQAVFALWLVGRTWCYEKDIQRMTWYFGRAERNEVWLLGSVMPQWLYEWFEDFVDPSRRIFV